MPRRALEQLPQAILVNELRRAIDIARNANESTTTWELAVGRIAQLCRDNPTSSLRPHVLHNLGCTRRRWLRQLSAKMREPNASFALHLDLMSECRRKA